MAAIDFPASPTNGQLFTAGNGVTYQYNGTLWLAAPAAPVAQAIMLSSSFSSSTTGTTSAAWSWDTIDWNSTGGTYTAPNFVVPAGMGGLWEADICFHWSATSNSYLYALLMLNGTGVYSTAGVSFSSVYSQTVLTGKFRFTAGDSIRANVIGGTAVVTIYGSGGGAHNSWMHLTRLGA